MITLSSDSIRRPSPCSAGISKNLDSSLLAFAGASVGLGEVSAGASAGKSTFGSAAAFADFCSAAACPSDTTPLATSAVSTSEIPTHSEPSVPCTSGEIRRAANGWAATAMHTSETTRMISITTFLFKIC
jgi:hypothetical protein